MVEFTKRAKRVINEMAGEEAKRLGHDFVGPEHIFLGLLREEDSVAVKILINLNINLNELKREVEKKSREDNLLLDLPASQDRYQRIVESSKEEAKRMKHNYVGTEHILLALLRDNSNIAAAVLSTFGVNYNVIKSEILRLLGVPPVGTVGVSSGQQSAQQSSTQQRGEKSKTPILDEFARDLTQLARDKKLDPVIGRAKEIERVIQILSRKTKNNPVLIGESGVGKTAIVEGLAIAIVEKTVPELLYEKRVLSLDLAGLIAGTKYRGEFEERLKKIMKEITSSTSIIIFIDELHTLIGAGAAEGAVDAANILKPALARGELQCIGATTNTEYRKYIEKDSALERRFQTVKVAEPSVDDAIKILDGLKKAYESHHKVRYTPKALEQAVKLSHRYINDRYLPDKAIDIIDEAGSKARLANCGRPENIKEAEEEIRVLSVKKEELVRSQEYEKAAAIRDEVNRKKLVVEDMIRAWQERLETQAVTIDEDQILSVISMWTGIPLEKMEESENEKLISMEKILRERVVGQNTAIETIARAVRRSRTGFKNERRPTGSFIFLGPTGVGKTELAKALATFLFGKEDHLLRIDMSEYMEPHAVSRLIGAPPGYVGYDDGGQLTEFVRRKPYSVILLDEIEKAHHDLFNILLQIMEEGNLTDTKGRKVNFRDTILIMTSNIGAKEIQKGGRVGFEDLEGEKDKAKSELARDELKKYFNPEFLNRVDEVIYFQPLTKEEIVAIVDIMLKDFNARLLEKKIMVSMTLEAKEYMSEIGYDSAFGARPLRRIFQKELEDYMATQLLTGAYKMPTIIKVDAKEKKFNFEEQPWEDYGIDTVGSDSDTKEVVKTN
ncbi:MAG TPA: ATP-dependent Clp protease ATP-binding subunit [Leptospiraceae bacterium]|nr:ATP-dependent Clp protease ATP-binding subunit [Leptospiraceae bacterium]HMW07808.1 ATP-dependent Clp protease ATP-binding subunit [Leptospiraceae bacterium]HMX35371.1 ATP-dependent Clp protease ATP-binding subunit [Leptospiraceae bacterium]HMY33507.1 ATP-dependent Clp protease ATP-binding subunit [Leptospiraceae bacterium]HMZ67346.1 ATP-dependent Clp protease ATP-binding subunit [Leptospiraceae bacterium]